MNYELDFEQRQRAVLTAESRGIDDETAFELVWLRDFRTRVLELVRKKAEEYEADTVGPEGRASSYYASRSSARAWAARELEKEIGELG